MEKTSRNEVRRSRSEIPARRVASRRATTLTLIAVVVLGIVAAVAGFALRPIAETQIVLWYARHATGLRIDARSVEPANGGYLLSGVWASSVGGTLSVRADRVMARARDRELSLTIDEPEVAFASDRMRGDEAAATREALQRAGIDSVAIAVRNGRAMLVAGAVPEPLVQFDDVRGTVALRGAIVRDDLTGTLVDADARDPVSIRTEAAPDGGVIHHLIAASLPLDAIGALLPSNAGVTLTGGRIANLDLRDGATLRATADVSGGSGMLGSHTLADLHGPIALADGGVGSSGLFATIDGIALHAAGEVHDLGPNFSFVQAGSNDLGSVVRLVDQMASEPRVRSIAVEADAPGLDFGQYAMTTDHGPLVINVLAIDPHEPTLRFDTAIADDHIVSGGERTSAMGVRTGAVAGVNGDYFDIGRTYQPQGMLVRAGKLIRGPVERAVLAIDRTNHVTFGEYTLVGSLQADGATYPVTQLNDWPVGNVTVITPEFGKTLPPAPGTTFARLEPAGSNPKRFRVTSVESDDVPLPTGFGVALGPDVHATLRAGEVVRLSYRTDPPLGDAVAAIGGGPILVRDGEAYEDPHAPAPDERNYRWPVVALAQTNDDRLLLVAVDGRHPERSVGMMRPEFSDLLLRLGARNAMALDSGGSVTLVSRKVGDANVSVRNAPSDNSAERWISDALYLYSSAPAATIVPAATAPTPVPEVRPSP